MKRKWYFLICALILIVYAGYLFHSISYIVKNPVIPVQNEKLESVLIKWVYDKSSRISLTSAKIISKEVMKTDKPLLLLALIEMESQFVPSAFSSKEAIGLTQVMFEDSKGKDIHGKALIKSGIIKEKRDLFDITPSIQAGNLILDGYLIQSKGDVPKALERYLGGKDGAYLIRILSNLANLYVLTSKTETKQ